MYIFIVNTVAGRGQGLKIFNKLKKQDIFNQIRSRSFITEYPGHAELLAKQAVKMYPSKITSIIVIGGDGTLHEVLNGLGNYNNVSLSFIPAGSGNDFARGYHIKGNPCEIFKRIVEGKSKSFWPGSFSVNERVNERRTQVPRLFANSIGFGFDAEIVKAAQHANYKRWINKLRLSRIIYAIATVDVLRNFQPKSVDLVVDGKKKKIDNVWMVSVTNHPYYGGGMKIIPGTKNQPDVFPVLLVANISPWKVLALFLTVFWGGHIRFKEVSVEYVSSLQVYSESILEYQVDGQSGTCHSCRITKESNAREIYGIAF
ncbi:diacylglycerol/lipid kinase family protein [Aquibacillus saliphilus]|uniref:diacylglycerol/lipid kinase family protein n=1 Tax=Aquibacillus saliphilus TaxID=1909422 RepID=UPI001CEFD645|nr:YegS/Rv2252/BmrU family lipid kinase [Aquibacillus saliphilus]